MIDIATRGVATALSPAVAPDSSGEAGSAFATLLMQALARDGEGDRDRAPPMPAPALMSPPVAMVMPQADVADVPIPVPVIDANNVEPPSDPVLDARSVPSRNQPIIDHAVRFDARGVLNMAATGAEAARVVAATSAPVPRGVATTVEGERPNPIEASLPAQTLVLPETAVTEAPTVPAPVAALRTPSLHPTPSAAAEPPPPPSPEAPEDIAPLARPRARTFATLASRAPQVAVAALADGLAVVAAVGALSDVDRHRLRDAIAATVARHGYHPRAVTLLAMPAPSRFPES